MLAIFVFIVVGLAFMFKAETWIRWTSSFSTLDEDLRALLSSRFYILSYRVTGAATAAFGLWLLICSLLGWNWTY
jgi:hypothetical protein